MSIAPVLRFRPCLSLLLAGLALVLPASHARAGIPPAPPVVAAGDVVPSHGRIGHPGGTPRALDAGGRVLVVADAVDNTRALLWTDGRDNDLIARSPVELVTSDLVPESAVASPDGRLVLALGGAVDPQWPTPFRGELRQLRPTEATLLTAGTTTREGFTIVVLEAIAAVSDDGAVVFTAIVDPGDAPEDGFNAVLLRDADGVHTIAGNSPALPDGQRVVNLRPLGRSDTGAVFFSGSRLLASGREDGVFRWHDGEVTPVVRSGDAASDGTILEFRGGLDSSTTGAVLFRACAQGSDACAIYRTEDGASVPVHPLAASEVVHDGALNARGDAVLVGRVEEQAVVWLHRAGAGAVVEIAASDESIPALINEAGAIAWLSHAGVERRDDAGTRRLLGADAHLADGTALLSGGLAYTCLADDGRLALTARVADGSTQWVCVDGDGIHALDAPQDGDATPADPQCAFAGADLVLLRNGNVERHTDAGRRTVLRPGDRPDDLEQPIERIAAIRTNALGTILAFVHAGREEVIRIDASGRATRVALLPPPSAGVPAGVLDLGLTPDDAVVALIYLAEHPGEPFTIEIVRIDDFGRRRLWTSDPALRLSAAHFRGDIAVVQQIDDETDEGRLERIDLRTGDATPVLSAFVRDRDIEILSLRANGDLLFTELVSQFFTERRFLYQNNALFMLSESHLPATGALLPVAIGDGGHRLYTRFAGPWRGDATVALNGPAVSARCPVAASTGSHDDDACQINPAAGPSAWPLLIAATLLIARRFRR